MRSSPEYLFQVYRPMKDSQITVCCVQMVYSEWMISISFSFFLATSVVIQSCIPIQWAKGFIITIKLACMDAFNM